jgi:hypothetical protein
MLANFDRKHFHFLLYGRCRTQDLLDFHPFVAYLVFFPFSQKTSVTFCWQPKGSFFYTQEAL